MKLYPWMAVGLLCGGMLSSADRPVVAADDVPEAVLRAEQQRIANIDRAQRAAVSVFGVDGKGGGSGVVVTPDGYALTNFHVVQPCGNHMKCGMSDGQVYDAVVVGLDPTGDVALIKLLGRDDFPVAELGDSDQVRVGDWCFAVGNPFLLATDLQPTVSYGIVSGVHRYQYPAGTMLEYADCIQTDAAINPGNSGGPLFNAAGQLIGVNGRASFEKRGRVNVGVGYAISINQIKKFLGQLRSGRIVDHATLGATVVTDDRGRVIVSNVLTSSDAFRRGLRYGDELLSFDGRPITTVNGFKNALGIMPRGWRVPMTFQRGGQKFDVNVRLAGVHTRDELIESVQRIRPPTPEPRPTPERPQPDQPQPDQPQPDRPQPEQPAEDPHSASGQRPMPPEVAALLEARAGYANYYFNRLERTRVWDALAAHGSFFGLPGRWVLRGESPGAKIEIELADPILFGRFPDGPARVDTQQDLSQQLHPIGSGGLLVAMHLWKRFLQEGPEKFGEVYYMGEAPLPGREQLYDVLIATYNVLECHLYFDKSTGRLAAMEMYSDIDIDPCEVYFHDYQIVDGRAIPAQIEVVFGDQRYGEFRVTELQFATNSAEPGSGKETNEATSAP